MRAEAPSDVKKGEQIGIKLGLFNYFNQDLEVHMIGLSLYASNLIPYIVLS